MAKSILKSKVFWVAILQGIFGVVVVLESAYPAVGWVAIAKSVVDIILRGMTTTPVAVYR